MILSLEEVTTLQISLAIMGALAKHLDARNIQKTQPNIGLVSMFSTEIIFKDYLDCICILMWSMCTFSIVTICIFTTICN